MATPLTMSQAFQVFNWIEKNNFVLIEDMRCLAEGEIPAKVWVREEDEHFVLTLSNEETVTVITSDDKDCRIEVVDHTISIKNANIEMTFLIAKIETTYQSVPSHFVS